MLSPTELLYGHEGSIRKTSWTNINILLEKACCETHCDNLWLGGFLIVRFYEYIDKLLQDMREQSSVHVYIEISESAHRKINRYNHRHMHTITWQIHDRPLQIAVRRIRFMVAKFQSKIAAIWNQILRLRNVTVILGIQIEISKGLPSREPTCPTFRKGKSSTQKWFGKGYVSSQEGNTINF